MYTDNNTKITPNLLFDSEWKLQEDAFLRKLGHIARIYNWIVYSVLVQLINMFGICTNTINIICFTKQGFKDPVNISLLGLAVADLGSLVTTSWTIVCLTPAFLDLDLPFDPFEIQYVVSGMPHTTFTRISALITAVITVERWICIVMPFKVHQIVTPRKVAVITVTIFIANIVSGSPVYFVFQMGMKFFPDRNKTMIGLIHNKDTGNVENISYIINNAVLPYCTFITILCFTIALAINMHMTSNWKKTFVSNNSVPDNATIRNQRAAKMVIMISVLFIACFTPMCSIFLFLSLNPEYNFFSKYKDIVYLVGGVAALLESINSSMNICIYYRMSTNYRSVFRKLFSLRQV